MTELSFIANKEESPRTITVRSLGGGARACCGHRRRHRIQMQALILTQHVYQRALHLLHGHRDRTVPESLTQFTNPGLHYFGLVLQLSAFPRPRICWLQAPHVLLIGMPTTATHAGSPPFSLAAMVPPPPCLSTSCR